MKLARRTLILATLAVTALAGCGKSGSETAVAPLSINQGTSCSLDGMLLADYPGPKAQIHYAGQAEPDFFCDTVEMFHMFLNPEQVRAVRGIFVQDMGRGKWNDEKLNASPNAEVIGMIVEYSLPEPSTATMAVLVAGAMAVSFRCQLLCSVWVPGTLMGTVMPIKSSNCTNAKAANIKDLE